MSRVGENLGLGKKTEILGGLSHLLFIGDQDAQRPFTGKSCAIPGDAAATQTGDIDGWHH
jgi:hypothetical protein